jgi:beta-glucosidase
VTSETDRNETILQAKLAELTLEEKVHLCTGMTMWSLTPIERIGLRELVVSDGPSGVRGVSWDERSPSLNLPSASSLSSTWSRDAAHLAGVTVAGEARRKGVHAVLGPTINLHRSPLGGRHFEAFSEDPHLTAFLADALVDGIQSQGVAACLKHYVANDYEEERFTANSVVSERALRELYLLAFEKAVVEARSWMVMSSYNLINGVPSSENDLLETPLKSEWGFDGVVVSDWFASQRIDSARAEQDLLMPGPMGPWGQALVEAIRAGDIEESTLDRKVIRILRLAGRVGALDGVERHEHSLRKVDNIAVARSLASEGSVLLRNEGGALPWSRRPASIAVIGDNAKRARSQGGGSATVVPTHVVTPLAAIEAEFGSQNVTYAQGAIVHEGIVEFALDRITNPTTGEAGVRVTLIDHDGAVLKAEDRFAGTVMLLDSPELLAQTKTITYETVYAPETSGTVHLGVATVGLIRLYVNNVLVGEGDTGGSSSEPGADIFYPKHVSFPIAVVENDSVAVRFEIDTHIRPGLPPSMAIVAGTESKSDDSDAMIAEAVANAATAEVAVVVVGTNSRVESEGFDRKNLSLPGRQDDLVRAVTAVNPNTIVLVNSGSPVLLPWRNEVRAILLTYFAGQEMGDAIVDMLLGRAEPGGRLPTTWAATEADVPVLDTAPKNGVVSYDEGIHIGYRAFLKKGTQIAYPFGFGLGYTSWSLAHENTVNFAAGSEADAHVEFTLKNTGARPGKQVVQVYAERPVSVTDRPVKWLVGFSTVNVDAGGSARIVVPVSKRSLAYWDGEWVYEPGEYTLTAGLSVTDSWATTTVSL